MVEHSDPARRAARADPFRPIPKEPRHRAQHADPAPQRPGRGGLLERRRYNERPPRDEYVLTERGRDFQPVLYALLAWGNKHFATEGASVLLADSKTGAIADPVLVDRASGRPLVAPDYSVVPGPTASEQVRRRLSFTARQRADAAGQP